MKAICLCIYIFLFSSLCFANDTIPDKESQLYYDHTLYGNVLLIQLDSLLSRNEFPDCRSIFKYMEIGDEFFVPESTTSVYRYFLESAGTFGLQVRAENKLGGRSYIYDYGWNVVHYVFTSSDEAEKIGESVIEWVTTENFSDEMAQGVLLSLGWRGLYNNSHLGNAKYDVLGCLGDFLIYDRLRSNIWTIALGGNIYEADSGREMCVRSILSNYEKYPKELQKEVQLKIANYLESADDKDNRFTKKIADFIRANGGIVPDRTYLEYDIRNLPINGGNQSRLISKQDRDQGEKESAAPPEN